MRIEESLIGLSEFEQQKLMIEREYAEKEEAIKRDKLLSDEQLAEALILLKQTTANKILQIEKKASDKTSQYWKNQYRKLGSSVKSSIQQMIKDTDTGTANIGELFKSLAVAVRTQFFDVILDAIGDQISGMIKTESVMITEQAVVRTTTSAYISLAAAKAAATLGLGTGAAIAADPRNDDIARKWGRDAGDAYLEGFLSVLKAPTFGENVIGRQRGNYNAPAQSSIQYVYIIHDEADVETVEDKVIPIIEGDIRSGRSDIVIQEKDHITGSREGVAS